MKIDKNKIKSILFITLSNLGDVILTTPVLEKLCDEFPGASIDVVTSPVGREIFSFHPRTKDIIVYEKHGSLKKRLEHFFKLRRKKYDLVVDLKNTLVPYLLGARFKTRLSFTKRGRHKMEEHLTKLSSLGIDAFSNNKFFAPITNLDRNLADQLQSSLGEGAKMVVISPGAKSHLKRWDATKFALLADRLAEELGCRALVCGNEDDRQTVDRMMALIKKDARNLCCKTSVGALSEIMKRSALVITNDSAPLHMASATDAPTVAIFGPSDEVKYGPLAEKRKIVKPDVPCRPCGKALCAIGPDKGCIDKITVEQVFDAAKELLEEGR